MAPRTPRDNPGSGPDASGAPERLTVGLVRGLRGLRGQVRIELLTDTPEERFPVGATLYREPVTHWTENIGTTTLRSVIVELKSPR